MYPVIDAPLLRTIWRCAEYEAPKEAVGMLAGDMPPDDGTVIAYTATTNLTNVSADPEKFFALDREEVLKVMKPRFAGRSLVLWHSHVAGLPKLSEEDMEVMWVIKLPMLVVSLEYSCAVMYSYLRPNKDGKQAIVEWGRWGKP